MQGVAEAVPVSSSAQLALLPWLTGRPDPPHRTTFAAALHAGSCAGVAWAMRADLRALSARRAACLAATSVPSAVTGYLVADAVEARLGTRRQLAVLLAGAGLALAAADRRPDDRGLDGRAAAVAALAQVAALVPGVSRSGAVLTALRLLRVDRADAHRFASLMSLPVSAGAAGLTLARAGRTQIRAVARPLAAGIPAAGVAAALATTAALRRGGAPVAASSLYRLALAVAVAARLHRERRTA